MSFRERLAAIISGKKPEHSTQTEAKLVTNLGGLRKSEINQSILTNQASSRPSCARCRSILDAKDNFCRVCGAQIEHAPFSAPISEFVRRVGWNLHDDLDEKEYLLESFSTTVAIPIAKVSIYEANEINPVAAIVRHHDAKIVNEMFSEKTRLSKAQVYDALNQHDAVESVIMKMAPSTVLAKNCYIYRLRPSVLKSFYTDMSTSLYEGYFLTRLMLGTTGASLGIKNAGFGTFSYAMLLLCIEADLRAGNIQAAMGEGFESAIAALCRTLSLDALQNNRVSDSDIEVLYKLLDGAYFNGQTLAIAEHILYSRMLDKYY